jgi:hypothetical protein
MERAGCPRWDKPFCRFETKREARPLPRSDALLLRPPDHLDIVKSISNCASAPWLLSGLGHSFHGFQALSSLCWQRVSPAPD